MKKLFSLLLIGALATGLKAQDAVTGNVSVMGANNYLTNGFSFDNNPVLFVNGSTTAQFGDTYLTGIGIHSRNIGNHFNGKTSWVEYTGMADLSQDLGFGTASIGAYHTLLPKDVFGLDAVNGVYGQFKTNTNPLLKIFLDRGFKNINGLLAKLSTSTSVNILGQNINGEVELGLINDYFIKKKGVNHLVFDLNSEIISNGPLKVSAGLKYQKGIGNDVVTGLQGRLTAGVDF